MATRLYFHSANSAVSNLPTIEQSSLTPDKNVDAQTVNRLMDITIGTAQTSLSVASVGTTSAQRLYYTRFVSEPLSVSSITAGTWTLNFAGNGSALAGRFPAGTTGTSTNNPVAIVAYVWRPSTQTVVGFILDGSSAANVDSATNERVHHTTFSGALVSGVQNQDVICFELTFQLTQSTASVSTDVVYFDGTTVNTTKGASVSNHASFLETAQNLTFSAILTRVSLSRIYKNQIEARVSLSRIYKNKIEARVSLSRIYRNKIRARVSNTEVYKNRILVRISRSRIYKNRILNRISLSRIYRNKILARVSDPQIYKNKIRARVSLSRIYKNKIRSRISLSRIYKNKIRARISLSRIYRNRILVRISSSEIYKNRILNRISLTRIYKNKIRARVSLSRIYKNKIVGRVSLSRIYKNKIRARVSLSRIYKNKIRARVSSTEIYKNRILNRISLSRIYKNKIRARVSLSRIYKNKIVGRVSLSRIYKNKIVGRVSLSRIYKNKIRARVSLSRIYKNRILNRISLSRIYKNKIRARVSLSRIYKNRILQRVGGYAVILDGIDDNINLGNDALWNSPLSKFSFSIWINPSIIGPSPENRNIVNHGYSNNGSFLLYMNHTTGKFDFLIRTTVATSITAGANQANLFGVVGDWFHLTCVYDNSLGSANLKIYVNGILGNVTANLTEELTRTVPIQIGGVLNEFGGNVKDFRYWGTKALTPTEIDDVEANSPTAPIPDYWLKMDEESGSPIDSISGTKTATLVNGAVWAGKLAIYKNRILNRISSTEIYKNRILVRISSTKIYKNRILVRISNSRIYKNKIRARVSLSRIYKNRLLVRISRPRVYKNKIQARVSLSRIYKNRLLNRISRSRIYKNRILIRVSLSRIYKNKIVARVSLTRKYVNQIIVIGLTRISLNRTYKNKIQARVSNPRIYKNKLLQRVGAYSIGFDGINDYVDCGNDATLWSQSLTKFSFSFWTKLDVLVGATAYFVNHNNGTAQAFACYRDSSGRITFEIRNAANTTIVARSINASDFLVSIWYNITCVYDNSLGTQNLKIYINGNLCPTTANLTESLNNSSILTLGRSANTINGTLKDFRWFTNKALTQAEIDNIEANSPSAPVPNYWLEMDERTGNPVDSISGTKTGILTNGPVWEPIAPDIWTGMLETYKNRILQRVGAYSLYFDGVNDYLDCKNDAALWSQPLTKFSFSLWIYAQVQGGTRTIIVHGSGAQSFVCYQPGATTDRITFRVVDAAAVSHDSIINIGTSILNRWVNLIGVYDSTLGSANVKIYADGVLAATTNNLTETINLSATLFLASSSADFQGYMKDLRWFTNKALTTTELNDVRNNYPNAPTPNYWLKMDDRVGNPVDAISGTKTATLTNGTLWISAAPDVWTGRLQIYINKIIGRISLSRDYQNRILNRVSLDRIYSNRIFGRISLTRIYRNKIRSRVSLSRIYKNRILNRVSLTRIYRNRILNRISLSRIYRNRVLNRVSLSRIYKNRILSRLSLSRVYKNRILNRISLTRIYKNRILNRISLSRVYKNKITARVSLSRIYKNQILERVSLTRIYENMILVRVSLSRTYRNRILERVSLTRTYVNQIIAILTRVSLQRTYINKIQSRVSLTRIYINAIEKAKKHVRTGFGVREKIPRTTSFLRGWYNRTINR